MLVWSGPESRKRVEATCILRRLSSSLGRPMDDVNCLFFPIMRSPEDEVLRSCCGRTARARCLYRWRCPCRHARVSVQRADLLVIVDEDTLGSELFTGSRHFESICSDLRQIRLRVERNSRGGCVQLSVWRGCHPARGPRTSR